MDRANREPGGKRVVMARVGLPGAPIEAPLGDAPLREDVSVETATETRLESVSRFSRSNSDRISLALW